jgi:hypothetical protein
MYVPEHGHASGQLIKLLHVLFPWTAVRYGERGGKRGLLGTIMAM